MTTHLCRAASAAAVVCATACLGGAPPAMAGPSTGHIVFSSPLPGGGASVGVVAPDGSGLAGVPVGTDLEDFDKSTWSHDGTHLLHSNVFVFDLPGVELAFRPAITDADGGNLRVLRLPDQPADMYCSTWSPDDTRIVCAADGNLVSLRASDGGGAVVLTHTPYGGKDLAVGYSPDGSRLAFLRSRPGPQNGKRGDDQAEREALFVADADGSHARQVSAWGLLLPHELAGANWAPNGRSLISVDRHGRLVEIAADGSGVRKVGLDVDGKYFAVTPDYSPDGSRIVFGLFQGGPSDLWVADADGSDSHPVTDTPDASEWFPDWATLTAGA